MTALRRFLVILMVLALGEAPGFATALEAAVLAEDASAVQALLDAGADPNERGAGAMTPLHHAALIGNVTIATLLLDAGADINARDDLGSTPLHYAGLLADSGPLEMVTVLLKAGADPNLTTEFEEPTPLMKMAVGGHVSSIKELIAHGAVLDASDNGVTALDYAAGAGQMDAVRLLLDAGATPTAAALIATGDATRLARLLDDSPGPVAAGDNNLLYLATSAGSCTMAGLLLDHGADVNRSGWGVPLMIAVNAGDASMVELLLSRGANPNVRNPVWCGTCGPGKSALALAEYEGRADIALLLRAAGADPLYFTVRDHWRKGLVALGAGVVLLLLFGLKLRASWRHAVVESLFRP